MTASLLLLQHAIETPVAQEESPAAEIGSPEQIKSETVTDLAELFDKRCRKVAELKAVEEDVKAKQNGESWKDRKFRRNFRRRVTNVVDAKKMSLKKIDEDIRRLKKGLDRANRRCKRKFIA
jgi:hypothetical protein